MDYRHRLALVAERDVRDGPELIAVGRYEPTGEEAVAEVALVVEYGWQSRGLGETLLARVLAAAEARGIRRFRGNGTSSWRAGGPRRARTRTPPSR